MDPNLPPAGLHGEMSSSAPRVATSEGLQGGPEGLDGAGGPAASYASYPPPPPPPSDQGASAAGGAEAGAVGGPPPPMMAPPMVNMPLPAHCYNYEIPPPKDDFSAPPPYEVATKLPTYDEVQQEKRREVEAACIVRSPHHLEPLASQTNGLRMLLAIDAEAHPDDSNNAMLGTDFMFFTAFVVSFLFNWIGFLLLMCFCHTIAARYGALSGFGLSLSKWTLIVKHSTDITEHVWLWWLIMSFGLLICIRAIIQYLNIKRGWRLLSGNPHAQERLLFFY